MRHFPLLGLVVALGTIASAAASCSTETGFRAVCSSDAWCQEQHGNSFWRCEPELGDCVCTADEACTGEEEHCELYPGGDGRCHPNKTCEWNGDCTAGFCDLETRFCRLSGCTNDLQCNFGEICDTVGGTCVEGCRSHGDCDLGDTCMCGEGEGRVPCPPCEGDDRSGCQVGQCVADTCADDTFCRLGDYCVHPDEGAPAEALPVCESAISGQRPFCGQCQIEPGQVGYCGSSGPNFCLVDTSDPSGRASFCGVDCSDDPDVCPNGFGCRDVLRLLGDVCRSHNDCVPRDPAKECEVDQDCGPGAQCKSGKCAGMCAVGEGAQSGFCGCVLDSDCPQQTCGADNRCTVTRKTCVTDEECREAIRCVNNGEIGYCFIGQNCAPDQGISCSDVRCDQDPSGCGG